MKGQARFACYPSIMDELWTYVAAYYQCTALAEAHVLTQTERFACNETYQQVKRLILGADVTQHLTREQNLEAYVRFKSWEVENAELIKLFGLR